jgi:hypothetical protein
MVVAPTERRQYRRSRAEGLAGFIRYLSREDVVPVRLIDLGNGGAGVMLEPGSDIPAGTGLSLLVDGLELPGVSVGTRPDERGWKRLGIRFDSPFGERERPPVLLGRCGAGTRDRSESSWLEERASIVDDASIMKILDYFIQYRKEAICIRTPDGRFVGRGRAELVGRRLSIEVDDLGDAVSEGALVFSFQGFIAYYEFKERILAPGRGRLTIDIPLVLMRQRKRRFPRLGTADLPVWVTDPMDGGRILQGRVLDLDFGGLALELEGPAPMIHVGTTLRKVVVRLPGCGEVQLEGMVRHMDGAGSGRGMRLGIEAASFFRGCRQVWNRYVFNLLLPDLMADGFDFDADEFIDVLDRSGYLALCGKKPAFYGPILPSFRRLYESSDKSPDDRNFVFHFGDEPMGVISKSRLYAYTFMIHHLAVPQYNESHFANKDRIANHISIGILINSYLTDEMRHCVFYVNADKKWSKHIYDDFLEGVSRRSAFVNRRYRFLEYDLTSPSGSMDIIGHSDVEVACREDAAEVSGFLGECVPPLMFEAYDYDPEKLDLSTFNRRAAPGLSRERTIFLCRRQGRIEGAAVAEATSRAMNLFNLGDGVRVFTRRDLADEEQRRIKSLLLRKAVCCFAARCKPYFVFFCYDEDCSYAEELGFRKIDESREIILDREILPSYIDYIETTLSMAERMKGAGKTNRGDQKRHSGVGQV